MIIGVDARPLSHPATGIGRYTDCLLQEMTRRGHEWRLFSSAPFASACLQLPNVRARTGRIDTASPRSLYHSQWSFGRWAKEEKIDLFWSPRHHLPIALPASLPCVVTIHDVVWKRYPQTMRWPNRVTEQLLMPRAVRRAQRLICVSRFTAREVSHFWPGAESRSSVVYSGATRQEPADGPDTKGQYFLFVGTAEPRKNLTRLLHAFAAFSSDDPQQRRLVIVGDNGWGAIDLRSEIERLGITSIVDLYGRVDDAELHKYYANAECLLLPSLYEGCGLPVIEAMQYGVPALVAERGAPAEMAGDACLTCDPASVKSIAGALAAWADGAELRRALREQARERAPLFDWARSAEQTLAIFDSL